MSLSQYVNVLRAALRRLREPGGISPVRALCVRQCEIAPSEEVNRQYGIFFDFLKSLERRYSSHTFRYGYLVTT